MKTPEANPQAVPQKGPGGRPPIEINWENFDKLCHIGCLLDEIASFFNISEDTIERAVKREKRMKFAEYRAQKLAGRRLSLRRKMWDAVQKGNITMMIFLSKQREERGGLGFSDRVDGTLDPGTGTYEKMMGIVARLEANKRKEQKK